MGKQKKSAIETRLETLENIVLSDGQNIGEALGITYVTIQESLVRIGDFAHDLTLVAQNLMTSMGELVPDEYTRMRVEATAPPDLTVIEGEGQDGDDEIS